MSVEQRLLPIIRTFLSLPHQQADILPDVPLRDLGLDSLAAIDLLFKVEETFQIAFPDALLNEKTFGTRGALQRAVEALLREAHG
jgi:acyl carrier protein